MKKQIEEVKELQHRILIEQQNLRESFKRAEKGKITFWQCIPIIISVIAAVVAVTR